MSPTTRNSGVSGGDERAEGRDHFEDAVGVVGE